MTHMHEACVIPPQVLNNQNLYMAMLLLQKKKLQGHKPEVAYMEKGKRILTLF